MLGAVIACGSGYLFRVPDPCPGSSNCIIGGKPVPREWKNPASHSVLALTNERLANRGKSFCTATLIYEKIAVTAAHCIDDKETLIGYGQTVKSNKLIKVISKKVHPKWNGTIANESGDYDIALIKLAEDPMGHKPVEMTTQARPNMSAMVVGYGITKTRLNNNTGVLRYADTKITSLLPKTKHIYVWDNKSNSAAGDSGGPLFIYRGNELLLAGVVSFGTEENGKPLGEVWFTSISDLYGWIELNSKQI